MKITKATEQLRKFIGMYSKVLPLWTFPYVPFLIATVFQVFAWTSGSTLLGGFTLFPRIIVLWLFALGEYLFMSPAMNAGVEVLGMSEALLVIIYNVMTFVVFLLVDRMIYKNEFKVKYVVSFILLALALFIALK